MTTLIITEKHKQAQSFAKVLGANDKNTQFNRGTIGYYERKAGKGLAQVGQIDGNERVIVSWAAGHLLRTALPDQIDDKMKRWRMEDLPFFPERWKFLPAVCGVCCLLRRLTENGSLFSVPCAVFPARFG